MRIVPIVLYLAGSLAGLSTQAQLLPPPPKKRVVTSTLSTPAKEPARRYPSLLWEITGKGMKKPSYLFGTMHVSNKLAFHLGDTFYNAIRSADVVALETNPDSWQEDYSRSPFFNLRDGGPDKFNARERWESSTSPMQITTFAIDHYDETVKAALAVEPSMINGLLYRTLGAQTEDFEEDTFLDMYIFQIGKKLGKRLSGVENFAESEKLVMEAYMDMARDENRKRKSYDREGNMTNPRKLEEAYRRGDLDLLDSLEALTVTSDAFQEKFLYKRNEIQANSIDSIIQKQALFVGVGAAHLPGKRGVIEMLREKGYTLRPVFMDERSSAQKDSLEKHRMEHAMVTQTAADGFYQVAIPGKQFYRFTEWNGMDVVQYADLVNGAYYMVTRVKTNGLQLGHSAEATLARIDSLLYEHVPGKIIRKTAITTNGYKGYDIVNRTRRGDYQRYNIFVTPFEVILFKISGNGEYVTQGTEADRYFQSIRLQEYHSAWSNWLPVYGGFTAQFPHSPVLLRDNNIGTDRLEYAAWDVQDGNSYLVMKANLHNYHFLGEDTFELGLMEESYAYSVQIDKEIKRKFTTIGKYPALEVEYRHKDGSFSTARFLIRGPHYYVVLARYKKENANVRRFLESFAVQAYQYNPPQSYSDSTLYYRAYSPISPYAGRKESSIDMNSLYEKVLADKEGLGAWEGRKEKSAVVGNDTTGEKILVYYERFSAYDQVRDSATFKKIHFDRPWDSDSSYVIRYQKTEVLPNNIWESETHYTDTGSSRLLMIKTVLKDNHEFRIVTVGDTLGQPGSFVKNFFSSFHPADTLKGASLFVRKTGQAISDLLSKDSATARKASRALSQIDFDSTDVPLIRKAIDSISWAYPNYLASKKTLIEALGKFKDTSITGVLEALYWQAKDTSDFQQSILKSLTRQRTRRSLQAFRDLIIQEPPIDEEDGDYDYSTDMVTSATVDVPVNYRYGWYGLEDSLALTKTIFPDILQLLHVNDYESKVMGLLTTLVDSGQLKGPDYEPYISKIYLDGKRLLKKQLASESKGQMEKAGRKDQPVYNLYNDDDEGDGLDEGNEDLEQYATLLFPFKEKNPGVQAFFTQLMQTTDRRLLYDMFIFLLRRQQAVPDSLFTKYAALDKYRSELYGDLEKLNMTDKFPLKYRNQKDITRSLLVSEWHKLEKADTLAYLDKLPVTYKGRKGWVHFYKYKMMRDDVNWQVAAVGRQPLKETAVSVDDDAFNLVDERKLEPGQPVKKQLEQMLREMVNRKQPGASAFYEAREYRLYKSYLAEAVKRRRYRD